MSRSIIVLVIIVMTTNPLLGHAQKWFPPVHFAANKYICDTSSWQLVFLDNFDGNKLNTQNWFPFNTNNGGNTDNWCEARIGYPGNKTIIRDENVVISNGTAKLKIIQNRNQWQCESCLTTKCTKGFGDTPMIRNYTSGYISSKITFNNGKFETRLKMPTFNGSWATVWLWALAGVNEIDIAESWGGRNGYIWPHFGKRPATGHYLHAWAPNNSKQNQLPKVTSVNNTYPKQQWWHWFTGNYFHQEDWHIYTCEWDTASITTYLDYQLINKIWKYYQWRYKTWIGGILNGFRFKYKVGAGCQPKTGQWLITKGFPYNNNSYSKLIFSVAMTHYDKRLPKDGLLGQMEIDYVKVWQRHPEKENHPTISTLRNAKNNAKSKQVQNQGFHQIKKKSETKAIIIPNKNKQENIFVIHTSLGNSGQFQFFIPEKPLELYSRFEWNIVLYTKSLTDTQHIHKIGRYISVPDYLVTDNQNYFLHWQVKMTNNSGLTTTRNGFRTIKSNYGLQKNNPNLYYLDAVITDKVHYIKQVHQRIASGYLPANANHIMLNNKIQKAMIESLSPFILLNKRQANNSMYSLAKNPSEE